MIKDIDGRSYEASIAMLNQYLALSDYEGVQHILATAHPHIRTWFRCESLTADGYSQIEELVETLIDLLDAADSIRTVISPDDRRYEHRGRFNLQRLVHEFHPDYEYRVYLRIKQHDPSRLRRMYSWWLYGGPSWDELRYMSADAIIK